MSAPSVVRNLPILCSKCQQGFLHPSGIGRSKICTHCTVMCCTQLCHQPAYISKSGKVSKWCFECYDPAKAKGTGFFANGLFHARGKITQVATPASAVPKCCNGGCSHAVLVSPAGKASKWCSKCYDPAKANRGRASAKAPANVLKCSADGCQKLAYILPDGTASGLCSGCFADVRAYHARSRAHQAKMRADQACNNQYEENGRVKGRMHINHQCADDVDDLTKGLSSMKLAKKSSYNGGN